MPIYIRSTVREGVGYTWIRPPFDPYFMTSTGAEISTDNNALVGEDSNHLVTIYGRVEGALSGIVLGNDVNQDSNETIRIGATGYVLGAVDGIHIDARNSNVRNEGIVVGRQTGVELNANVGASRLVNSGTILSDNEGIRSTGAQTLVIENSGTIYGLNRAIATFGGATALITNTGEIVGEIYLDSGNDVYNGVNGRVSGPITCFGGNDTVNAGIDDDFINGMSGNDILNGGVGADRMDGGADNDTFYVDNIGDVVIEGAGGGTSDWVVTSISYTLGAGAQVETFSTTSSGATTSINLTGNVFAQRITGNAGSNIIIGGGGADRLEGLGGTDTASYANATVGVLADLQVAANNTNDAAGDSYSSIENLTGSAFSDNLRGDSNANVVLGGAQNDQIYGRNGNDVLNGQAGIDTLHGGANADIFIFDQALTSANADRISDFASVDDTIRLENAVFLGLSTGTLSSSAFRSNTTGLAGDSSDRIIYESDNGKLYFDRDGTGDTYGSVHFATVTNFATAGALSAADFQVI